MSWYTTRDTSTWFEATDSQAWIPSQQKLATGAPEKIINTKSGKSDVNRSSKEIKGENRKSLLSANQTETFFELPPNTVSDQNAWNAYVLSNSSDSNTDASSEPGKAEKVVFSKLKRNVDIEEELTKQNLYKTELCQSFIVTASCRYGTKCQFAHGMDEVRPVLRHPKYKTEICKTFSTSGRCPYGKRCRFIHSMSESSDDLDEIERKVQEINLNLAPDPVFPSPQTTPSSPAPVKKGSRLPFLQKLRKQL